MALLLLLILGQEPLAAPAGQRYLDRVAEVWRREMPLERLLGVYMGRRWVGHARFSVRAAPEDGAAFDVQTSGELRLLGKTIRYRSRVLLDGRLGARRAESSADEWETKVTKTLTVEGNAWKRRRVQGEKVTETSGPLGPGMTWDASMLPLFARPEDAEVYVISLDSDKGALRLRRRGARPWQPLGGEKRDRDLLEIGPAGGEPDRWYFEDDGRPAEFVSGELPLRMRTIDESRMGKDLEAALVLAEPLRTLASFLRARKRGDREAFLRHFDMVRLARTLVPEYDGMGRDQRRAVVDGLKRKLAGELLSQATREALPEEDLLEDFVWAAARRTDRGDEVDVVLLGRQTWKFVRARGEEWLIHGFDEKP